MNLIFLSGFFSDSIKNDISTNSIGAMQNAADVLQKNYLDGFINNVDNVDNIKVVNVPFIGGYPGSYKEIYYSPAVKDEKYKGVEVKNISFLNLKGVKNIFRLTQSFLAIRKAKKCFNSGDVNIVSYSMHLPFLISCYLTSLFSSRVKYYIIVPDLPEFMLERKGVTARIYGAINKLSYYLVNKSDGASIITDNMKNKFDNKLNSVTIEGIITEKKCEYSESIEELGKYILYSGTLDRRYGIRDLLESYIDSGVDDVKLVVCGDGDDRKYLLEKSSINSNIVYLGQVEREKVRFLQNNAFILVNPRNNEGEFTKYSFPSKTIEYMMSGRPLMMYKLDGMPSDYDNLFYEIESKESFASLIRDVSTRSENELNSFGVDVRNYMINNKSPKAQVNKMLLMILGNKNV
ncbi:glycosyltransferase [Photobacterium leiognathi subsp. mandapamensis]|uniref:glycosyltransferase n=1 Tax=Photobacterium leiognathi TaxID=553611 RepID=UPI003BF467A0